MVSLLCLESTWAIFYGKTAKKNTEVLSPKAKKIPAKRLYLFLRLLNCCRKSKLFSQYNSENAV
jgi:hypothetical protein